MEQPGHYSPDGRWWWNGARWVAVSEHRVGGPGRHSYRVVLPILSVLVIGLVGVVGVMAFIVSPGIVKGGVQLPTGGGVAATSVTSSLKASGFECSLGYTTPARVWFCFQTRSHDYSYLGIQVRDSDQVGWVSATVARNASGDPDVTPRATQVFSAIAAAVVGDTNAGAAKSWVQQTMRSPGDVGSFGDAQMEVQKLADPDQQAMYEFDASVASTQKKSIPGTQLNGVSETQVTGFFEQHGLTCEDQGGLLECAKASGDGLKGVILPTDSGTGVQFYDVGVLPSSGDQTSTARSVFTAAVRLGLKGADADKGVSWVDSHLDGGWHDIVMNGVHLSIFPESSRGLKQGGGADVLIGAWHW